MCGLNGIVTKKHLDNNSMMNLLFSMNELITHRGPDQDGYYFNTEKNYTLGMAMRRLSIIDLTTGNQPIYSDNRQIVIVFNGEIYNFKTLKSDLIAKGLSFHTSSDTEVVLKLYECYGTDSFAMLDGMFAFSIYDKNKDKIIFARDFFGEKPLYYHQNDSGIIWASELKSIIKTLPSKPPINRTALNLFLQLTYIPAPYSIYEGIHKLEANHYLEFDCTNFSFQVNQIIHKFKVYPKTTKSVASKITHDLVQESVTSRSIADVPLGTFLSGGVDSSIVSLCLSKNTDQKIDTFSIGFEKKSFDETNKSRMVAKIINSNHHEFIISEKDLTAKIDEIILNFDEPFADSSALANYVVSSNTKKFVTVALTGDGGDEVFGGYNKYFIGILNKKFTQFIPEKFYQKILPLFSGFLNYKDDQRELKFKLSRLLKSVNYQGDFYYNIISLGFHENELKTILKSNEYLENSLSYYKNKILDKNKTLRDFRNIDRYLSLDGDMLVKVDRTSMLCSLECRAPFLNKEIWNFASQLPENFLIKGFDKKHILKEAFKEYFPKDFLDKPKKGFGVPVGDWLRTDLKNELLSYIKKDFIEKQNIFEYESVSKIVNNHANGMMDNTLRVWTFFCFQKWYKHFFKE